MCACTTNDSYDRPLAGATCCSCPPFAGAGSIGSITTEPCDAICETFDFFVNYANAHGANTRPDAGLILLGLVNRDRTLQGALSALHVILWKFVLIAFTRVDTEGMFGYRQCADL